MSEAEDITRATLGTAVMCLDLLEDVRARLLAPLIDPDVDHEGRSADDLRNYLGMLSGVAVALAEQISFAMEVHDGLLDLEDHGSTPSV